MTDRPNPVFRTAGQRELIGPMAVYASQADASDGIPRQWREFLLGHPGLRSSASFYGASPCTDDHRIHYLTGILHDGTQTTVRGERLILAAGDYAVVRVDEPARLRDTWTWLLNSWLPASGRREKNAPEFERFTGISEHGAPVGPVEIWIPLQPQKGVEE